MKLPNMLCGGPTTGEIRTAVSHSNSNKNNVHYGNFAYAARNFSGYDGFYIIDRANPIEGNGYNGTVNQIIGIRPLVFIKSDAILNLKS